MPIFVVQEHHATHLHWDFRLEVDGILKSWAIPKSPPLKKGLKRLAILVEDHDITYVDFEGEIKEGYGKGKVKIWDAGIYELLEKNSKEIKINIKGKKLKGKYCLIKTNFHDSKRKNDWLIFKI